MELSTKNWLWLEQIAAKASRNHQSSLSYAKSFQYTDESPSEEEVISNVQNIIADPSRYIHLPQMMPGREETRHLYQKMTSQYSMDINTIESIQSEYINEDTSDPHVMKSLIKFVDILKKEIRSLSSNYQPGIFWGIPFSS